MKIIRNISQTGQWMFADPAFPFQVRVIRAAELNPVNHIHQTMHECFYISEGDLDIQIGVDTHHFKKDDLFMVEPGEPHFLSRFSPNLILLLIMPPPVKNDKIDLPDPAIH